MICPTSCNTLAPPPLPFRPLPLLSPIPSLPTLLLTPTLRPQLAPPPAPCDYLQGVRSLFSTLLISLPAFWNVGALLLLMFYMYAYVGVLLFGKVKRNRCVSLLCMKGGGWAVVNTLIHMVAGSRRGRC
jgi:hypothetical protein